MGVLEVWGVEKDVTLSRPDLQHLLELLLWFDGGVFQKRMPHPRGFPKKPMATTMDLKEKKWVKYLMGDPTAVSTGKGGALPRDNFVGKTSPFRLVTKSSPWNFFAQLDKCLTVTVTGCLACPISGSL